MELKEALIFLLKRLFREIFQNSLIPNCIIYSSIKTCSQCLPSFYITNSICKEVTKIENCSEYSKINGNCIKCNKDFFLFSKTECKKNLIIKNCTEYSRISNTTECIKCSSNFYRLNPLNCSERIISKQNLIKNCKENSFIKDKCEICKKGFILANTGDECLASILNCEIYNNFSKGSNLNCSKCENGYYLSNNICEKGSDINCLTFLNSENKCDICKEKYFKTSTICEAHQEIFNCEKYSQILKNTCQICQFPTYNFKIQKWCKLLPEIPNCKTYNHNLIDHNLSSASCGECEDGYFLNGNICDIIKILNCKKVNDNNLCTHCREGFGMFNNGGIIECKIPYDFLTEECDVLENSGDSNRLASINCTRCKINSLTVSYENSYACINDEHLKDQYSFNLGENEIINGCIKYENKTTCAMCESGKFLSNAKNSCELSCGNDVGFDALVLGDDEGDAFVKYNNLCRSAAVENNLIYAPEKSSTEIILIKCKPNTITVVSGNLTTNVKTSNININGYFNNWVEDIGTSNPEVTCPNNITKVNEITGSNLIKNCEYYKLINFQTEYGCIKCNHGYHGKPSANGKYIENCLTKIPTCDISTKYTNLPGTFTQYFSCHKCLNPNEIPFLIYKPNSTTNIQFQSYKQFTLSSEPTFSSSNTNKTIECINFSSNTNFKTSIGVPNTNQNSNFITTNCGLGLLNISEDIKNNLTDNHSKCAICKPGYFGIQSVNPENLNSVTNCLVINNCSYSTWFNSCSKCDDGYVFKIETNGDLDFTQCILQNDFNCFASKDNGKNCELCNKGFFLNRDGECEVFNAPKCVGGRFGTFFKVKDWNFAHNLRYLYWYNEHGAGCNECFFGYTAFLQNDNLYGKYGCVYSEFVNNDRTNFSVQRTNSEASSFINNCESYFVHSLNIICAKCNENFVIRADGSECISLPNCIFAHATQLNCLQCNSGYSLVNNSCLKGNIQNCTLYDTNNNNPKIICKTCEEGYSLSDTNFCIEGEVTNCLTYKNTSKECSTCKPNYSKIRKSLLSTSRDYCYKPFEIYNCKASTITNSTLGAQLTCQICSQPNSIFITPDKNQIQTACIPYNIIPNCKIYNTEESLNKTNFMCKICFQGYYLTQEGFNCEIRKFKSLYCKTFDDFSDICIECEDKFFLSKDMKDCIRFPEGVAGCVEFIEGDVCVGCEKGSFLEGEKCIGIEEIDKIKNCLKYSNSSACSECESGFFLENNNCVVINVSNCLTVKDRDNCKICLPGHRLIVFNEKTNCQSYTKPNCITYEQSETNKCLLCKQNFFINSEGNCTPVSKIIKNCSINDKEDTCLKCSSKFALSKNKKFCEYASNFDKNCSVVSILENMSCSRCNPGFYFRNGTCVAYKSKSFENGCYSQDFFDENICLFCKSGYYMDLNLKCIKSDEFVEKKEVEGEAKSNKIVRYGFLMVLIWI